MQLCFFGQVQKVIGTRDQEFDIPSRFQLSTGLHILGECQQVVRCPEMGSRPKLRPATTQRFRGGNERHDALVDRKTFGCEELSLSNAAMLRAMNLQSQVVYEDQTRWNTSVMGI